LLQTDAVHQLLQAVHGGFCCAVMPLDGGLEKLTDHLRLHPIENAQTLARLGLIMRRSAPRSALAEACFAILQQSLPSS
jgi:DNA-binding transcriptional LysR family regulator